MQSVINLKGLIIGCLIFYTASRVQSASFHQSIAENIQSIMDPLVATNNYAGNVVVLQNDSILFQQSYGNSDEGHQLENNRNTKFMLASASMIFTSAAIMKLVDERRMSLADKVDNFFPEFKNGDRITVHHMLAQRSGIPAWDAGWAVENLNRDKPHTTSQLMEYFEGDDLVFEPGSNYAHGRSEYILLAAIVEQVSGLPFGDYLEQAIFKPLGMHSSGHISNLMSASDIPNLANGYTEKGFTDVEPAPAIHWSVKTGHASIYSTVDDLARFAQAVLNRKLLSRQAWEQTLTDYGSHAGYGWFLNAHNNHTRYQVNGRSPGFASYFGIYPDDDLVVIMLSNRYVSLPYFVGPELAAAALGDSFEVLNLSIDNIPKELAKKYTGHYSMGANFYRPHGTVKIRYRNGRLYSGAYPLIPVMGENGDVIAFIHRHYWSRLEFGEDSRGGTILHFDDHRGTKQGFVNEWKWVILSAMLALGATYAIWKWKFQHRNKKANS